jgi:predicted nucleic acid-binding protein
VNLYAESSAVLAWLLDEAAAPDVIRHLNAAPMVVASDLTLIECDRVLLRAAALGELAEAEAADRRAHLVTMAAHWQIVRMADEVVDRARKPFPAEPVRTLDAIHLATAITARAAVAGLALLSLDERVRASGKKLGFEILPAQQGS